MKLYATVSSERASKAQGGNDFLRIQLYTGSAKDSRLMGAIVLENLRGAYILRYQSEDGRKMMLESIEHEKGEKQKGDKCYNQMHIDAVDNVCTECGKEVA